MGIGIHECSKKIQKMSISRNSLRQLKRIIRAFVEKDDFDSIIEYLKKDGRTISALYSMSYDKESVSSWRCIHFIGKIVGRLADEDYEEARGLTRRFLWDVTEESGTIGWSVPEILGEVIRENPDPFMDIIPLIFSLYDEEMPFRAGVLYAIGRIGEKYPQYVREGLHLLKEGLESEDKEVCANAIIAAKRLNLSEMDKLIMNLKNKEDQIRIYLENKLKRISIGEITKLKF